MYKRTQIIHYIEFYLINFSLMNLITLEIQFDVYIMNLHSDNKFSELKRIGKLARKIVNTKKDKLY